MKICRKFARILQHCSKFLKIARSNAAVSSKFMNFDGLRVCATLFLRICRSPESGRVSKKAVAGVMPHASCLKTYSPGNAPSQRICSEFWSPFRSILNTSLACSAWVSRRPTKANAHGCVARHQCSTSGSCSESRMAQRKLEKYSSSSGSLMYTRMPCLQNL